MTYDSNEGGFDFEHQDEGEGLLDEEEINLDNVEELQSQIDAIEEIENPIEKEATVEEWQEDLNAAES